MCSRSNSKQKGSALLTGTNSIDAGTGAGPGAAPPAAGAGGMSPAMSSPSITCTTELQASMSTVLTAAVVPPFGAVTVTAPSAATLTVSVPLPRVGSIWPSVRLALLKAPTATWSRSICIFFCLID